MNIIPKWKSSAIDNAHRVEKRAYCLALSYIFRCNYVFSLFSAVLFLNVLNYYFVLF